VHYRPLGYLLLMKSYFTRPGHRLSTGYSSSRRGGTQLPGCAGAAMTSPATGPARARAADRERNRGKTAYGPWAIEHLDTVLRHDTPRLGLWLDTSSQTPAETTDEIFSRAWDEARVPDQAS